MSVLNRRRKYCEVVTEQQHTQREEVSSSKHLSVIEPKKDIDYELVQTRKLVSIITYLLSCSVPDVSALFIAAT